MDMDTEDFYKFRPIHILGCRELFRAELSGTYSSSWMSPPAISQLPESDPVGCSKVVPYLVTPSTQKLLSELRTQPNIVTTVQKHISVTLYL